MNTKLTIFTILGLSWCFVLALFVYTEQPTLNKEAISADALLSIRKPVTILAFGDMMLDRAVRKKILENGPEYPFAQIKDFIKGDIVVANAEGPFTYNKSVTMDVKNGPLVFTFDPAILPTLKSLGFTLFSQANNHTLNFGMSGFRQSTSSIVNAGLNWFGDPSNKDVSPYIENVRGEKIAFIGYHEFVYQGLDKVLDAIKEAKKTATFVVVYPHWGEEYLLGFTSVQQQKAYSFIDAGADVVIGAHPHVIEPIEIYKNKLIFYSLGNFVFDQGFDIPTGRGLSVKMSLKTKEVQYDLFPFFIEKQQVRLMSGDDRQGELDSLSVPTGTIIMPR